MSSVLHSPTLPQYRFTEMKFTNAMIVLEGLTGKPVAKLCTEHQKNHSQYDQWRDQFLVNASKAFEVQQQHQREAHLAPENARLKALIEGPP